MEKEPGFYWVKYNDSFVPALLYKAYNGKFRWAYLDESFDYNELRNNEIGDRIPAPDEVCEWKHNVYTDLFRTECGKNVYKHVGIKWNFCPYCARRIKIID